MLFSILFRRRSAGWAVHLLLLLGLSLALSGCGSNSDDQDFTSNSGGGGAVAVPIVPEVQGVLVRVNPVLFVPSLSEAPDGSRPIAGGLITAKDYNGDVRGFCLTNGEGEYFLDGLPAGEVTLEAREDPTQAVPDATIVITSAPESTVTPGQQFGVSRQVAIDTAMVGVDERAMVAGSLNPLPAGVQVSSSERDPELARELARPEWFFMVDPTPEAALPHNLEYRFIDAETGEMTTINDTFYPSLNERRIWSYTSLFDYSPHPVIGQANFPPNFQPAPRAEVVQTPSGGVLHRNVDIRSAERILSQSTDNDGLFAVLVNADTDHPDHTTSINLVRAFLVAGGVPIENIREMHAKDSNLRPVAGKNFFLKGAQELYKRDISAAFADVNQRIDTRTLANQDSTLVYYSVGHGSDNHPGSIYLLSVPADFRPSSRSDRGLIQLGLFDSTACRYQIFIEACFSGPFIDGLSKFLNDFPVPQIELYSSTDAPHFTTLGAFAKRLVNAASVSNGGIANLLMGTPGGFVINPALDGPAVPNPAAPNAGPNHNPQFFFREDDGTCEFPPRERTFPQDVPELQTVVSFRNDTNKEVELRLVSENRTLNGGNLIRLGAGQEFTEEIAGSIQGLSVRDFKSSGTGEVLSDLGTDLNMNIRDGMTAELVFKARDGACALSAQQGFLFSPGTVPLVTAPGPVPNPGTPDPSDVVNVVPSSVSANHVLGVTNCPQLIDTITITNTSAERATFVVLTNPGVTVQGLTSFGLDPGESTDRNILFDCSRTTTFSTTVRVIGDTSVSGQSEQQDINVAVNISSPPAPQDISGDFDVKEGIRGTVQTSLDLVQSPTSTLDIAGYRITRADNPGANFDGVTGCSSLINASNVISPVGPFESETFPNGECTFQNANPLNKNVLIFLDTVGPSFGGTLNQIIVQALDVNGDVIGTVAVSVTP